MRCYESLSFKFAVASRGLLPGSLLLRLLSSDPGDFHPNVVLELLVQCRSVAKIKQNLQVDEEGGSDECYDAA